MFLPSLAHATGPSEEVTTGQEEPRSTSLQDLIKAAVLARALIMFSGESGAALASGIKEDAATAEKPTFGLVRAALEVVFNDLDGALFDPHAAHRPCGVLDRYEAVGMLIGDACGLPLMPCRPHGLAVGKKARKIKEEILSEQEKARKAAKRRGEDPAAAAAAVLLLPAKMTLPSAADCVAAPAPAPALAPAPELEQAPLPPPPVIEKQCTRAAAAPAAVRPLQRLYGTPDPAAWGPNEADMPDTGWQPISPGAPAAARAELSAPWLRSREAADAIIAASDLEDCYMSLDGGCKEMRDIPTEEKTKVATVYYKHALQRLQIACPSAVPELVLEPQMATEHNSMPCPYGFGRIVRQPWALHLTPLGFCEFECLCGALRNARDDIVVGSGVGWPGCESPGMRMCGRVWAS